MFELMYEQANSFSMLVIVLYVLYLLSKVVRTYEVCHTVKYVTKEVCDTFECLKEKD